MISLLQKKSLKFFHPVLRRLVKYYLSKPRDYQYNNISIKVFPGVFHPGLFFSTKVFLEYLRTMELKDKQVLELGAGSGLISIYCVQQGAFVTSSDINEFALQKLDENAKENQVLLKTVASDLFDKIDPNHFDLILINPPYYPRKPSNLEEKAWFCGEEFEYFEKLFHQLDSLKNNNVSLLMILSEDCDLARISSIAMSNDFVLHSVHTKIINAERNDIFELKRKVP